MRLPTWNDLERFCEIDGWERREGDHIRFRKQLPDGRILRTKVSRKGAATIARGLWTHIWRDQLALGSENEFWEALQSGEAAMREGPGERRRPDQPTLPAWLWEGLIESVGLSESEVRSLSEEEARARLHSFWSRPKDEES